ncbi:MAG: AsmA-like C-terminal region-containing protein [Candidatus Omnitrophota bacterium]
MPKINRFQKILAILISAYVIFMSLLNIFLCAKCKPMFMEKLTTILKRRTEIGSVSCGIPNSIIIREAVIYNVTNQHPLYYFKEMKIRPSILALIFERKLKFYCEIFPTKKFKAHIYATGNYDFKKKGLFLKFRLKDVPYTKDLGPIHGSLKLYKKPGLNEDDYPTDKMEISFTSPNMQLTALADILNVNGKTEIRGRMYAPFIKTDKLRFTNIESDAALIHDKLYFYNLYSDLYRGALRLDGYVDLDNPVNPCAVSMNINDMDIHEFSSTSSLFDKDVTGMLFANVKLKGSFGHMDSMTGKAWIEIKNANVWEAAMFKGIAKILMIPDLKKVVFTYASGLFDLKNSVITTNKLKLTSKPVELAAAGKLNLDGIVDASVRIKFKKELIESSPILSKLSSLILESAGWFLGSIKIEGRIQDPSFSLAPVGVGNIFNKIKDTIDKVKDILK